jgi:hypothetical protein
VDTGLTAPAATIVAVISCENCGRQFIRVAAGAAALCLVCTGGIQVVESAHVAPARYAYVTAAEAARLDMPHDDPPGGYPPITADGIVQGTTASTMNRDSILRWPGYRSARSTTTQPSG